MEQVNEVISDEMLTKHFVYVGAGMMAVALIIGFMANYIG